MEKEFFSPQNQKIEEKAEYVNLLKGQIVLKVASLEQLLFLKAQMEQKYKNLDKQLSQAKQKQYSLLKSNLDLQCKKVEITKKIENKAMEAALAVRQKNRISLKLQSERTQIEQLKNCCCTHILKQNKLKQQQQSYRSAYSSLEKKNEQLSPKIADYDHCLEQKLRARDKLNQVLHYYDQKLKELEKIKIQMNQKLSKQLDSQIKLQNQITQIQQSQSKTQNLLTRQSQQLINMKNLFESQHLKSQILKQKHFNTNQKLQQIINKNRLLNQALETKKQDQIQQNSRKQHLRKQWQEMRLKAALKIQYANYFVKELNFS